MRLAWPILNLKRHAQAALVTVLWALLLYPMGVFGLPEHDLESPEPLATDFSTLDTLLPNSAGTSDLTSLEALRPDVRETRPLDVGDEGDVYQAGIQVDANPQAKLDLCSQARQTGADCFRLKVRVLDFLASGYSFPGDRVEALVIEDTRSDDGVLIPKGAKLVGVVEESFLETNGKAPKAILALRFSQLWVPQATDPEPINAVWRKEANVVTVVGKGIGKSALEGAKGALRGAVSGIGMALVTSGSSLISSSGLGALAGIHKGILDTHSAIVLNEGDDIRLKLASTNPKETLMLSAAPATAVTTQSVGAVMLSVTQATLGADPFATPNQLTVVFDVQNTLGQDLSAMHIALVDDYGQRYYLSPFAGTQAYKTTFRAQQTTQARLTFTVKSGQTGYYLVLYDPARPREILVRQPLPKVSHS